MVDVTAGNLAEPREGGIDALGSGFPGIKREDLMVLPEADWAAMKALNAQRGPMLVMNGTVDTAMGTG